MTSWQSELDGIDGFVRTQVEEILNQTRTQVLVDSTRWCMMQPITAQEVMERLDAGEPVIFVDARPQPLWESASVTLPNAIHVPPGAVSERVGKIARLLPIVTYCTMPDAEASTEVARELAEHQRTNARPLVGGLDAWQQAGYPVASK